MGRASEHKTVPEIADRRNELAGQPGARPGALLHRKKVNELRAGSRELRDRYKQITIREVALDLDLDYPSKFDRTPSHIARLIEEGRQQASLFLEKLPGGRLTALPPAIDEGRQAGSRKSRE
jgi:NTE family protein